MKAYIDFYSREQIIPVQQKITPQHFKRRGHLYRELGCSPLLFKGKDVLEIGPGTGDNAVVTASFQPKNYELWDGNDASVSVLNQKIKSGLIPTGSVRKIDVMSDEFIQDDKVFDIVITEGASAQEDPKEFFNRIALKVNPSNGILIITCMSSLSWLSEMLRRAWYPALSRIDRDDAIQSGTQIFDSHLSHLIGRSRSTPDWILDSIFNPIPKTFSFDLSDMLSIASLHGLEFLSSSSPKFFEDLDWYKIFGASKSSKPYNEKVLNQWKSKRICLLDTRITPADLANLGHTSKDLANSIDIYTQSISEIFSEMYEENNLSKNLSALKSSIQSIVLVLSDHQCFPYTAQSLRDYTMAIDELIIDENIYADVKSFASFWGRGQQYISFSKHCSLYSG